MSLLVAVLLCSFVGYLHSENACNGLYGNFSQHLSSKTPYRYVANHDTEPVQFEGKFPMYSFCQLIDVIYFILSAPYMLYNYYYSYLLLGCKPWKIFLIQRHGTRTVGKQLFDFVQTKLPQIHQDIINNLNKSKNFGCLD